MVLSVEDQVVEFFDCLFGRVFSEPFEAVIQNRLRRNPVVRHAGESADAASQSLTRFFLNQQIPPEQVAEVLKGLDRLPTFLALEDIANPNKTPEALVEHLLPELPCPSSVEAARRLERDSPRRADVSLDPGLAASSSLRNAAASAG